MPCLVWSFCHVYISLPLPHKYAQKGRKGKWDFHGNGLLWLPHCMRWLALGFSVIKHISPVMTAMLLPSESLFLLRIQEWNVVQVPVFCVLWEFARIFLQCILGGFVSHSVICLDRTWEFRGERWLGLIFGDVLTWKALRDVSMCWLGCGLSWAQPGAWLLKPIAKLHAVIFPGLGWSVFSPSLTLSALSQATET